MMQQREQNILAVCHGGLLNYTMNNHSKILLSDKRKFHNSEEERRCITKRFGNCEMREFQMAVLHDSNDARPTEEKDLSCTQPNGEKSRPLIIMEEVTMEMNDLYALTDDENINVI